MADPQLPLFTPPPTEGPKPEDDILPPEIQEAMDVINGKFIPGEGGIKELLDGVTSPGPDPSRNDPNGFIKSGLLKSTDRVNHFVRVENPVVRVFDLANPDDQKVLEEIYGQMGDPRNGLSGHETPPQFMLDPSHPRGFRVLVVVKYWKVVKDATMMAPVQSEPKPNAPLTPPLGS